MFIFQYFGTSFRSLQKTLKLRFEPGWKIALYFFIMTIIASFPLNWEIIKQKGWQLNFVSTQLQNPIPEWYPNDLPFYCSIGKEGLQCLDETIFSFSHGDFIFFFNGLPDNYEIVQKTIVLDETTISFYDVSGILYQSGYQGFLTQKDFSELQRYEAEETIDFFANGIEDSLSGPIILFSVVTHTMINILINLFFIFTFALFLMIYKIGHSKFMTYLEAVKLTVIIMTIPVTVAFVVGLFGSATLSFNTVIISFGIPLVAIFMIQGPGKKEFEKRI